MTSVDLSKVSTDDLHAEIARRQQAARASGRPLKHEKKSDWARERAVDLRAKLAELRAHHHPGHLGHRTKNDQERALQSQIDKFDRLVKKFEREGV